MAVKEILLHVMDFLFRTSESFSFLFLAFLFASLFSLKKFFFCMYAFLFSKKKSYGQAAITDAIFFLLIVTGLAVFMFSFSATYGNSVNERFIAKYSQDVAIDSIKSILYSSVSRSNDSLYSYSEPGKEIYVDSFLALMKEDYTEDRDLEDDTRVILANNVMKVLSPIAPSEDFMFLMYESKNADFNPFFILLHLTKSPEFVSEGKYHYDYVCSGPKERFSQTLSSFSSVLNSSQQYFTPIKLFEETALSGASGSVRPEINGVVLLLLWKGEPFCNLINKSDLCDNPEQWDVFNPTVWNCKPLVLNELGIYIIE